MSELKLLDGYFVTKKTPVKLYPLHRETLEFKIELIILGFV